MSLIKIKQLVNDQVKVSFQQVSIHIVKEITLGLLSNKTTAGEIPIKLLKEKRFTFEYLTSCVSESISSGKFPDSLKLSNIVPGYKKKTPTDKCSYRPASILPLLSQEFEKIIYDQLYISINNVLNELLCRFCKTHSSRICSF